MQASQASSGGRIVTAADGVGLRSGGAIGTSSGVLVFGGTTSGGIGAAGAAGGGSPIDTVAATGGSSSAFGGTTALGVAGFGGVGTLSTQDVETSGGGTSGVAGAPPSSCVEPSNWVPLLPEVVAGIDRDGNPLALCRAELDNGTHPGKYRLNDGDFCIIGWGGANREIGAGQSFEGLQLAWASCADGNLPVHAYQFGEEPDHSPLYPCRASIEGRQHLGRIGASQPVCLIPYSNGVREIQSGYEVLVNDPKVHFPISAETLVVDSTPPKYSLTGVALATNSTEVYYLCSAQWNGGSYPGKIRADWKVCNIAYLGEEVFVSRYNVLVPSFSPHDPSNNSFWAAGKEKNGDLLGICRVDYPPHGIQLGKYLRILDRCSFPFGIAEVEYNTSSHFEVLRSPLEETDQSEGTRWGASTTYFFDATSRNLVNVCFNGAFNWDGESVSGISRGRTINGVRQGIWTADTSQYSQELSWFEAAMDNWSASAGVAFGYYDTCPQPVPQDFVPVVFTNVYSFQSMGGWSQIGVGGRVADAESLQGADREHEIGFAVFKDSPLAEQQFKASAVHEMGHTLGFSHVLGGYDVTANPLYACPPTSAANHGRLFTTDDDPDSIMNQCRDTDDDGYADVYHPEVNEALTSLDKALGQIVYGFPSAWISANRDFCVGGKMYTGKFNADDRTDLLCSQANPAQFSVDLADSSGHFDSVDWTRSGNWCLDSSDTLAVGDFNADGRDDLLCSNAGSGAITVDLAEPDGSFPVDSWVGSLDYCKSPTAKMYAGKFNADARADILCHEPALHLLTVDVADSAGRFGSADWVWNWAWCEGLFDSLLIADVNGDGRDDLVCHTRTTGRIIVDLARTNGSFPNDDWKSDKSYCIGTFRSAMLADIDGNGQADLLCQNQTTGSIEIAFGTDSGAFTDVKLQGPFARFCAQRGSSTGSLYVGKYSGGARSDLLCNYQTGDSTGYMEVQFSNMPQIY